MGNDRIDEPTTRPRTRTAPVAVDPRGVTLSLHLLRPIESCSQFPIPGSTTCAIVREFDALFDGRKGVRAVIHQRFPELRPPFTTGLNSRADNVIAHARRRKEAAHALDS
jgi:hypothetical protein